MNTAHEAEMKASSQGAQRVLVSVQRHLSSSDMATPDESVQLDGDCRMRIGTQGRMLAMGARKVKHPDDWPRAPSGRCSSNAASSQQQSDGISDGHAPADRQASNVCNIWRTDEAQQQSSISRQLSPTQSDMIRQRVMQASARSTTESTNTHTTLRAARPNTSATQQDTVSLPRGDGTPASSSSAAAAAVLDPALPDEGQHSVVSVNTFPPTPPPGAVSQLQVLSISSPGNTKAAAESVLAGQHVNPRAPTSQPLPDPPQLAPGELNTQKSMWDRLCTMLSKNKDKYEPIIKEVKSVKTVTQLMSDDVLRELGFVANDISGGATQHVRMEGMLQALGPALASMVRQPNQMTPEISKLEAACSAAKTESSLASHGAASFRHHVAQAAQNAPPARNSSTSSTINSAAVPLMEDATPPPPVSSSAEHATCKQLHQTAPDPHLSRRSNPTIQPHCVAHSETHSTTSRHSAIAAPELLPTTALPFSLVSQQGLAVRTSGGGSFAPSRSTSHQGSDNGSPASRAKLRMQSVAPAVSAVTSSYLHNLRMHSEASRTLERRDSSLSIISRDQSVRLTPHAVGHVGTQRKLAHTGSPAPRSLVGESWGAPQHDGSMGSAASVDPEFMEVVWNLQKGPSLQDKRQCHRGEGTEHPYDRSICAGSQHLSEADLFAGGEGLESTARPLYTRSGAGNDCNGQHSRLGGIQQNEAGRGDAPKGLRKHPGRSHQREQHADERPSDLTHPAPSLTEAISMWDDGRTSTHRATGSSVAGSDAPSQQGANTGAQLQGWDTYSGAELQSARRPPPGRGHMDARRPTASSETSGTKNQGGKSKVQKLLAAERSAMTVKQHELEQREQAVELKRQQLQEELQMQKNHTMLLQVQQAQQAEQESNQRAEQLQLQLQELQVETVQKQQQQAEAQGQLWVQQEAQQLEALQHAQQQLEALQKQEELQLQVWELQQLQQHLEEQHLEQQQEQRALQSQARELRSAQLPQQEQQQPVLPQEQEARLYNRAPVELLENEREQQQQQMGVMQAHVQANPLPLRASISNTVQDESSHTHRGLGQQGQQVGALPEPIPPTQPSASAPSQAVIEEVQEESKWFISRPPRAFDLAGWNARFAANPPPAATPGWRPPHLVSQFGGQHQVDHRGRRMNDSGGRRK